MIIRPEQWRAQPWKNGRGITHEVLRVPDVDDYVLRISVADVTESGPFSTFPGYTRWTLLLDGGPIVLGRQPLSGLLVLAGETEIEARVDAPATLLNVIGRGITVGLGDAADVDIVFDRVTRETRVQGRVIGRGGADDVGFDRLVQGAARGQVVWIRLEAEPR